MKTVLLSLLFIAVAAVTQARPIPVSENGRLYAPAPYDARDATIAGDALFMTAYSNGELALFLYRRGADGHWVYTRKLLGESGFNGAEWIAVAAEGTIVTALFGNRLFVFNASGGDYVQEPVIAPADLIVSTDVATDGQRILVGDSHCAYSSAVLARNAAGEWTWLRRRSADARSHRQLVRRRTVGPRDVQGGGTFWRLRILSTLSPRRRHS